MSFFDQTKIGAAVVLAGLEAWLHASAAWPLARVIGYWLGGVLLASAVAWIVTRHKLTASRFASAFFWTAAISFVLSRL